MTELMNSAVRKIDSEGEKGGDNQKRIAQWIIDNLITDDKRAAKILEKKSTISECMNEVKNRARKQAEGGCAMIEDDIVYGWVREFYGIKIEEQTNRSNVISLDLADLL